MNSVTHDFTQDSNLASSNTPAMKIKNNIAVSENGFVFNPASGESFSVNTVGLEILNMLRKGHAADQIIQSISNHFHAEPTVIERDLNDFIETLRQYHMIDHDED